MNVSVLCTYIHLCVGPFQIVVFDVVLVLFPASLVVSSCEVYFYPAVCVSCNPFCVVY